MSQYPPFRPEQPGQYYQQLPPGSPEKSRRRLWIILSIVAGVLILSCVTCGIIGAFSASNTASVSPTPTAIATATSTQTVLLASTDVATPLPTPTPSPTATATPRPTPTPKPVPTQKPTPTPTPCNNPCNPWGYNFSSGNLIYNPPSNFCDYFNCIASFWGSDDPGDGYVVQCVDGQFSQSGGERGACSGHSGVGRSLYSH